MKNTLKQSLLAILILLFTASFAYGITTLQVFQGGTGATSFTTGQCLIGNGTGAITTSACGGAGDVESVGDCASGTCLDGTSDGGTYIKFYDAQGAGQLITGNLTGVAVWTLPDATGTVALTSNLASYVPYTGATANLNLGTRDIEFKTGGNIEWSDASGEVFWGSLSSAAINTIGFQGTDYLASLDMGSLTNDRTFAFPDATGTLALTSSNVATATALASDPTDCAAGNFATTIAASGNLTCSAETDPLSATKALNNLASVAINTSLISDTDSTDNLGSSTIYWANAYIDDVTLNTYSKISGTVHANELTLYVNLNNPNFYIQNNLSDYFRIDITSGTGGYTTFWNNDNDIRMYSTYFQPTSDSVNYLGSSSRYWLNTYTDHLYLNSTAILDGDTTAGVITVTGKIRGESALQLPTAADAAPVSGSSYWDETNNKWYIYNLAGTTWKYVALGGHDIRDNLADLLDVNVGTPSDNQSLTWDAATSKWIPETITGGGVPTIITVADTTDTTAYVALFESATGDLGPKTDLGITYNAGTGMLTATGFTGPLTGLASTATALATDPADCSANNYAYAINASGVLTCSTIDISASTNLAAGRSLTMSGDSVEADAELFTDTKTIWFESPTAADDFKTIWVAPVATTITKISCESDQTVVFDLSNDDGTPTGVNGSDITCTIFATDSSMAGDATMAAGDRLDLAITSVSGTPTWVSISWEFTYDD